MAARAQSESEGSEGAQSFAFSDSSTVLGWRRSACRSGAQASIGVRLLCRNASCPLRSSAASMPSRGHLATTCDTFILAGWLTLLLRLTGHERLTLGLASSLREFAELQEAPGPLSCHLPLSATWDPSAPSETSCGGSTRQSRSWRSISATSALVCSICPRVLDAIPFCTSIASVPRRCMWTDWTFALAESEVSGEPSRLGLTAVRTGG